MRGTIATVAWALFVACGCAPTNETRGTLLAARLELAGGGYPDAIERIDRALASLTLNDADERELLLTRMEAQAYEDTDLARSDFESLTRRFAADPTLHERALKHAALAHNWELALEILDHARATDVEFGPELRAIETRIVSRAYAPRFPRAAAPDPLTSAATGSTTSNDIAALAAKDPSAATVLIDLILEREDFRIDAAERHALTRSLKAQGHYALAEYFLRRAIEREGVESEANTALLASLREHDGSRVKEFWTGMLVRLRPQGCYGDEKRSFRFECFGDEAR